MEVVNPRMPSKTPKSFEWKHKLLGMGTQHLLESPQTVCASTEARHARWLVELYGCDIAGHMSCTASPEVDCHTRPISAHLQQVAPWHSGQQTQPEGRRLRESAGDDSTL